MHIVLTFKALTVWGAILMLAVLNGVLRETILMPHLGMATSFILSGVFLSALIFVVAYFSLPWVGTHSSAELWGIGLGWLALTLLFEISFGLWQGKSWQLLLDAYRFKGGNIWPVVLVVTAVAPRFAAKVRGWT